MSKKPQKQGIEIRVIDTLGLNQIADSRGFLEQMVRQTNEAISKVRTHTDCLENQRRIGEEKLRRERAKKIQNEVITSHKKNVEIDWTWQELEEKEDCEELAKDIDVQKEACKAIIQQKEDLITQFVQQLKEKDDEYVKATRKQNDDIDSLIKGMTKQYNDVRGDYTEQLSLIEKAFQHERLQILTRNEEEIKKLFAEHIKLEEDYQFKKFQMEAYYMNELEKLKTSEADEQASTKIRLEKEMQTLQKCMEEMKAVYNLNQEKLGFNFKVLREKSTSSNQMKDRLKIQERKKDNDFRNTRDRCIELNNKMEAINKQTTREYKKFTRYYIILQRRFESFEKSDKDRYNEIRQMNLAEVKELCQKIMDCDKRIHEQQLGIAWQPPTEPALKILDGPLSQAGATAGGHNNSQMESSKHGMSKSEFAQDDGQMSNATGEMENADLQENFYKVKNVFDILIQEASYLIDEKSLKIAQTKPRKEAFLIMIDSIRKSLGIERMEDIELLVKTFYEYGPRKRERLAAEERARQQAREEAMASAAGMNPGDKNALNQTKKKDANAETGKKPGQNGNNESPEIPALDEFEEERDETMPDLDFDDVTDALDEFIKAREDDRNKADAFGNTQAKAKSTNLKDDNEEAEKQRRKERETWERITKVLSDKNFAVWRALDKALTKYHALLVDRQNLIEETGLLNQQNEELKTLLNQYLQAGVNHDLQVPPTQVIRLDI